MPHQKIQKHMAVCLLFVRDMNFLVMQAQPDDRLDGILCEIRTGDDVKSTIAAKVKQDTGVTNIAGITWLTDISVPAKYGDNHAGIIKTSYYAGFAPDVFDISPDKPNLYFYDPDSLIDWPIGTMQFPRHNMLQAVIQDAISRKRELMRGR